MGIPTYDPEDKVSPTFVKVFSIGKPVDNSVNETLVIYDDGTLVTKSLRLVEGIRWSREASPSRTLYGEEDYDKPANGTFASSFPESD
jgi:hypothetical protein